jgi:hypothetical protein
MWFPHMKDSFPHLDHLISGKVEAVADKV